MKNLLYLSSIVLGMSLVSVSANTNAASVDLVNAGFENPYLLDNEASTYIQGWDVVQSSPYDGGLSTVITNPSYSSFYTWEVEGRNVLVSGANEVVSQKTNTAVAANKQYTLQVNVGNRGFSPEAWKGYLIQLWAENVLLAESDTSVTPDERTFSTVSLTYGSTESSLAIGKNLEIRLMSYNDIDVAFDNVILEVSSVPLPGAVWLFMTGLLGMWGWKRSKQVTQLNPS